MNIKEIKNKNVKEILTEIEEELRHLSKWSSVRPEGSAFCSTSPFFMDTMEFHEWLQFVLIARFREMIENGQELPAKMSIFPYAYEVYKEERTSHINLLKLIHKLDKIFEK